MPFNPKAIANFFLDLAEEQGDTSLSPMKLQKLVYYAHGWYLGLADEPLIDEEVQAWPFGPVIPSLYHEFKGFGNGQIKARATDVDWPQGRGGAFSFEVVQVAPAVPDEATALRALLTRVWDIYAGYTANQLSNATHEPGTPWDQVWQQWKTRGSIPKNTPIPNQTIRDYFATQANRAWAPVRALTRPG